MLGWDVLGLASKASDADLLSSQNWQDILYLTSGLNCVQRQWITFRLPSYASTVNRSKYLLLQDYHCHRTLELQSSFHDLY